jgi:hypothetical protein
MTGDLEIVLCFHSLPLRLNLRVSPPLHAFADSSEEARKKAAGTGARRLKTFWLMAICCENAPEESDDLLKAWPIARGWKTRL